MSCRVIDENDLIPKYINGQLDPTAQDEIEVHILECPDCQQAVELLQTVRDEVGARAHEIRSYSADRGRLWWSWIAAAALVLFISGAVVKRSWWYRAAQPSIAQQNGPPPSVFAPSEPGTDAGDSSINGVRSKSTRSQGSQNPAPRIIAPPNVPVLATDSRELARLPEPEVAVQAPAKENLRPPGDVKSDTTQAITQAKGNTSGVMSDESERELFRLSSVRPAPYDLAGVSPHVAFNPNPAGARPGYGQSSDERRALFTNAMGAYLDRNYDEAADLLQRFLKTEPNAADANFYLGVILLLKGTPDQAFAPLKAAASNGHTRWTQPAHFYLAKAYLQTRDLASAETELTAAATMTGNLTASARADLAALQALRAKENR